MLFNCRHSAQPKFGCDNFIYFPTNNVAKLCTHVTNIANCAYMLSMLVIVYTCYKCCPWIQWKNRDRWDIRLGSELVSVFPRSVPCKYSLSSWSCTLTAAWVVTILHISCIKNHIWLMKCRHTFSCLNCLNIACRKLPWFIFQVRWPNALTWQVKLYMWFVWNDLVGLSSYCTFGFLTYFQSKPTSWFFPADCKQTVVNLWNNATAFLHLWAHVCNSNK